MVRRSSLELKDGIFGVPRGCDGYQGGAPEQRPRRERGEVRGGGEARPSVSPCMRHSSMAGQRQSTIAMRVGPWLTMAAALFMMVSGKQRRQGLTVAARWCGHSAAVRQGRAKLRLRRCAQGQQCGCANSGLSTIAPRTALAAVFFLLRSGSPLPLSPFVLPLGDSGRWECP